MQPYGRARLRRPRGRRGLRSTGSGAAARHGLPVVTRDGYPCLAHFRFDHPQANELRTLYTQLMLERGFLARHGALSHPGAHRRDRRPLRRGHRRRVRRDRPGAGERHGSAATEGSGCAQRLPAIGIISVPQNQQRQLPSLSFRAPAKNLGHRASRSVMCPLQKGGWRPTDRRPSRNMAPGGGISHSWLFLRRKMGI